MAKKRRQDDKSKREQVPQQAAASSVPVAPRADGGAQQPAVVGYERSDVRFRFVLALLIVAFCVGSVQFYGVWKLFNDIESRRAASPAADRLVSRPSMKLPAEPRLEQLDRLAGIETPNIRVIEGSKDELLATYGSTAEEGYLHVPIERAMDAVIGQLPVRKQTPEAAAIKDHGLLDSGESNSGRVFREAAR